jgi:hypothetical protein
LCLFAAISILKETSFVLQHGAQGMLNVINPHLGGPSVERFLELKVVFGQCMNGPWYAAGMFA